MKRKHAFLILVVVAVATLLGLWVYYEARQPLEPNYRPAATNVVLMPASPLFVDREFVSAGILIERPVGPFFTFHPAGTDPYSSSAAVFPDDGQR